MTTLALNLMAANVRCGNTKGNMETKTEQKAEAHKDELRKNITAIRQGHLTGGYCDTDKLRAEEKKLHVILAKDLEDAIKKHGYSPDPKFKHAEVRSIELELNGLSYKPKMVAAHEQ